MPEPVIDATVEQARALVDRQPQRAWALAQAAYAQAERAGDALLLAQARHVIGLCHTTLGRFADARAALAMAETTLQIAGATIAAACCRRDAAIAAYFAGDYPAASAGFAAALRELETHDAPLEASRCLRWMAIMANFRQQTADATAHLRAARSLIAPFDAPSDSAACRYIEGMIAYRQAVYESALEALADAAARFSALGEDVSCGRVLYEQGYVYLAQEEFAAAEDAAERALELFQRHVVRHRMGMAQELLAIIATYRNHWERAYTLVDAARAAYQAAGMEVLVEQARLHRANLDFYLDAWSDAEAGYREVAAAGRRLGTPHHVLLAESNLGLIAMNQGHYDLALAHTHAALEQAAALGRRDDAARCQRQLGWIHAQLGRAELAGRHFTAALAIMEELGQPLSLARTQTEYADMARQMGDTVLARRLLDAARAALETHGAPLFVADCDLQRARLAFDQHELAAAETLAQGCLAIYSAHHMLAEQARVRHLQGDILRAQGQAAAAHAHYQSAFDVLSEPFPADAAVIAAGLGALAQTGADDLTALHWYRQAVQLTQRARSRVPTEQLAAELARRSAPDLRAALALALRLGQATAALVLAEDARAQVALAWLHGQRRLQPVDATGHTVAGRCHTLRRQIEDALEDRGSATEQSLRLEHMASLQTEYDEALALWRRFGSAVIPGDVTAFDWPACRERLNALAQPWQALVYWLDDDWLIVWHCTSAGVQARERRLSELERFSLELCSDPGRPRRAYLYDRDPATVWTTDPSAEHLARVADLLLPPQLAAALTPDTLLAIIPAGPLHALPFAALPLSGKPLIEHVTLFSAPSLQLLARLLQRVTAAGGATLAIGVPHHPARTPLPQACVEAHMVAAQTGAEVWCDHDATAERLDAANAHGDLQRYQVIHIATHAWAAPVGGEQAGVALADRDLLVSDLAQLHLDADVTVLSACESGTAHHLPGEEMVGLAYSLLQAGSRALVTSLWQVEDHASLEMMRWFYDARKTGLTGPAALAAMQRAACRDGHAPYRWAGYTWIGKP